MLHHSLKPDSEEYSNWGNGFYKISTNSLGFRDLYKRQVDYSKEKLIILGDSFTESIGIDYEKSFPGLLQNRFTEAGRKIELLNAGVSSYSPFQYKRQIEFLLKSKVNLKLVMIMLDQSDVQDVVAYHNWNKQSTALKVLTSILFNYFELPHFLSNKRRELNPSVISKYYEERWQWAYSARIFDEFGLHGTELVEKDLLEIRDLLTKNQIPLVITIYPWPVQLANRNFVFDYEMWVKDFCIANKIKLINLFDRFKNFENYEELYIEGDVHWNINGHSQVANWIYESLLQILGSMASQLTG